VLTSLFFLIDEPDIYLHSDLQRQLLGILRNLGPDILMATHSTEIITEAEPDDIVVIDKRKENAKRIKDPSQLSEVFLTLGSNLNPILTQLAKTKRAVFVEGKDFQILSRFALKLGYERVSSRASFAVIPIEGFNPQRVKQLKLGMETTLGTSVRAGAILDRDFRCNAERDFNRKECEQICDFTTIHSRKELENFLLVPAAIDRAASRNLADRAKRSGKAMDYSFNAGKALEQFARERSDYVLSQHLANRRRFELASKTGTDEATYNELLICEFNENWAAGESRLALLPGKEALSHVNSQLQKSHAISVTPTAIIDAMRKEEVPQEMVVLIEQLNRLATA
jgi:predicted ATP-dependent endonuclease of OLD family